MLLLLVFRLTLASETLPPPVVGEPMVKDESQVVHVNGEVTPEPLDAAATDAIDGGAAVAALPSADVTAK